MNTAGHSRTITIKPLTPEQEREACSVMQDEIGTQFPLPWLVGILLVCITPFLLNLFGVDFGARGQPMDPHWAMDKPGHIIVDAQFKALSGAFIHTILEWSALCMAAFVVFLAFSHYKITNDVTTPILGIAFFMSGCMDAFHTLAADRLIHAVADNRDLVPFTWAICRMFNALILIAGVSILLLRRNFDTEKPDLKFILGISLLFGIVAYIIIQLAATSSDLPKTTYPDALLTRPYDAIPLGLFIFAGVYLYPRLYQRVPSLFSYALVLSAIPEIVTQLHMTFGSTALFDNHFNIAHFMKVIAYAVPLIGLTLDYTRAHKILKYEILEREKVEINLATSEAKQRAVIDTMVDAAITINAKGRILSFNPAAETIFGYTAKQAIGQNVKMLMPEPYHSEHDGYLSRLMKTGEPRILGKRLELTACRKDGTPFPISLSVIDIQAKGDTIFSAIVRDISEEKNLLKMKDEFISTISHELRTPITSIRGSLGLMTGGVVGELPEKTQSLLTIAHNNSERLLLLINDLLDFEKLTTGNLTFNFSEMEVQAFITEAIIANKGYADQHGVNITTGKILENVFISADSERLMQVMNNLLSNAAKFSPKGETITVDVARHDNNIRVNVIDNGPGIPEEFRSQIYEKFTQSDASDTRQAGGTGLGLNIAKAIIEKHNGVIDFSSEINKGTTFFFDFPEIPAPKN